MYIPGIFWSCFEGELCLNIFGFNIKWFSGMAWVYSIRILINSRKLNFNILCIYMVYIYRLLVYTWYIHGIYMTYTWYIPRIIFLQVPDEYVSLLGKWHVCLTQMGHWVGFTQHACHAHTQYLFPQSRPTNATQKASSSEIL